MSSITETVLTKGYAAITPKSDIVPFSFQRRACGINDVVISIKYAGICHSDIHQVREEWGPGIFPMVPGHEIGGHVTAIGEGVTKFSVGDCVGVGCMVDSCRNCPACKDGVEQYCFSKCVGTYNDKFRFEHCVEYNGEGGANTYGGYSQQMVVDENFVLKVPANLDLAGATPLLCAGVTTYSPLVHFGLRPFHKFAVAGLGGLGHMGAKFGKAFGAHTTVISRGTSKRDSALNELHADAFLDSTDAEAMKAAVGTFDFILNCISAVHNVEEYLALLKYNGKIVLVGAPPMEEECKQKVHAQTLIGGRKTIAGSLIGGIQETQDMLDLCGRNNITCDVEVIDASKINEAYERTIRSDVKYRFVIDTATF